MKKPFVQHRWAELLTLDEIATFMELDRLPSYGFTGAVLESSFMVRRVDFYYYTLPVVYERFAEFNAVRDQDRIKEGAVFLTEFIRRAHHKNLTVMHWHNVCNFVGGPPAWPVETALQAIKEVHPDCLNEHDEPDFSKDFWYDFMEAEIEDFFAQFPSIDGLFCWNCESSRFTPSRLCHQSVPRKEIVRRATKVIYDVCRRHGKMMTHDIHSGGANREQTENIIAAAAECPELILGADCTYSDWQFFLPTTPWLDKMRAHNRVYLGFDSAGEYFGKGKVLGIWPNWIIRHFMDAKEFGLTAVTTRTEVFSRGILAFASPFLELNVRALMKLALEGRINLDQELQAWWHDHFDGPWSPELKELILLFEPLVGKILHANYSGFTNSTTVYQESVFLPSGKIIFFEQFAEPGTRFDPDIFPMTPEKGATVKPFAHIRKEKLDGMALCGDAVVRLGKLGLPEGTRRLLETRFLQARDVALAHLYQLEAAHALYQQIGAYRDGTLANPKAAMRETLGQIRAHADAMDGRWGTAFYDRFTSVMRKFAASVPQQYFEAETRHANGDRTSGDP